VFVLEFLDPVGDVAGDVARRGAARIFAVRLAVRRRRVVFRVSL
jgi:hypothetical protein